MLKAQDLIIIFLLERLFFYIITAVNYEIYDSSEWKKKKLMSRLANLPAHQMTWWLLNSAT